MISLIILSHDSLPSSSTPCSYSSLPLVGSCCLSSRTSPCSGDTRASQVVGLTEEVTAVVQNARPDRGDKVRSSSALQCCAISPCAVPYCNVMLYCAVLHYAILSCAALLFTVLIEQLHSVSCKRLRFILITIRDCPLCLLSHSL